MAKDNQKATASKAAWDKARKLAARDNISIKEARSILAKNPKALEDGGKPAKPQPKPDKKSSTSATKAKKGARKKAPIDLSKAEAELRKKYPHIVPGTLKPAMKDGDHAGRRTVQIECTKDSCANRRTIATSDAFQVKLCLIHSKEKRSKKKSAKKLEPSDTESRPDTGKQTGKDQK